MSHKAKPVEPAAAAPKLRIRARAVAAAPRPPLVPRTAGAAASVAAGSPALAAGSAASTAAATHATVAQRRAAREQQRTQPPQRLSPKRSGGAKPAALAVRKPTAPAAPASAAHALEAEIDAPPEGVTDAASWFAAVTRAAEQMRAKQLGSAAASTHHEEEKHQPAPTPAAARILPRHEPSLPAAPRSPPALKKADSSQQQPQHRKAKAALRVSYSDEVQFAEARRAEEFDDDEPNQPHQQQQQQQQQHQLESFSLPITAAMRRDSEIGGAPTSRTAAGAREVYKMRYGRSKEEEAALAGVEPEDPEQENTGDSEAAAPHSPPRSQAAAAGAKKKMPKRVLSDEPTLGAARRRAAMKEMQALAGGAAPPVSRSSRTGLPLSPIAASPRISSDAGSISSRASSARSSTRSSPNASFHAAHSPSRQQHQQPQHHPHQPPGLSSFNAAAAQDDHGGTIDFSTLELNQLRDMNDATIEVFTSGEHSLRQSMIRDSINAPPAASSTPASGPASTSASFSASGSLTSSLDHLPLRSSAADMIRRFREAPPKSKEQRAAEEAQLQQQQQQQKANEATQAAASAAAPAVAAKPADQPKRSIPWWMAEALASPFSSVSASNDSATAAAARPAHNTPLALSTIVASPDVSLGESSMDRGRQHMGMGAIAPEATGEFNPRTNSILDASTASVSASGSQLAASASADGALSTAEFNPRTNSILLGESSTNFLDTRGSHQSGGSGSGPEDASLQSFERHVKDTLDSPAAPAVASIHSGNMQSQEPQEEMLKTSDFSDFDNRRSGSGSGGGSAGGGSLFDAARRSRDAPAASERRRQPSSSMYDSGGDDDIALSHSRSHDGDDAGEDEARPLDDDDDDGSEDLRRSRSLDQTLASHIHSGLAMTLTSPSSVAHHAKAAASTSSTSPPTAAAPAGSHAAKPSTDSVASGVSNISGMSGATLKSLPPLLSAHDSSPQITARGVADAAVAEEPSQFERRFVPPPERDAHLSAVASSRSRSASSSAKNAFKRGGVASEDDDDAPGLERIMSPDTQQVQDLSRFVRKSYTGSNVASQAMTSGNRSRSDSDLGAEARAKPEEQDASRLSQSQSVSAAPRDSQLMLSKSLEQDHPADADVVGSEPAVDQSIEEEISMAHSVDESTEALKAEVRRSSQQQVPDSQQPSKLSNDSSNLTPRTPLESTFASAPSTLPQRLSPAKDDHDEAGHGSDGAYASSAEEDEDYTSSPPQAVGASVHMKPLRGHRSATSLGGTSGGDSRDSTQAGVGASVLGASSTAGQLLPFSPPATAEPLPPLPSFPAGPMTCDLCHASSASSPQLCFVWCFDCRMKVCDPVPVLAHEASFEDLSVVPQIPATKSCHLDLHAPGKIFASHRVARIPTRVTEGGATTTTTTSSSNRPEYERSTAANRSAPNPSAPSVDAGMLKPPALSVGGRSLSTPSPQLSSQSSSTTSASASSRDRTISAALQGRGGFELVDANARMFAEVFQQPSPQMPGPPMRAQSALSLREKERPGSLKERQTSVGDESNRSFGSVEEEPSEDASSPRGDRLSAPRSGSSSASDLTPRGSGGRGRHRAQQSSVSSASSQAHSQRRARLLGMTPSPPISPVAAGAAGRKFGDFATHNEIKAAAAIEAEIEMQSKAAAAAAATAAADSSALPNDVIEEDLDASESSKIEVAPSPSTLPPIAPAPAVRSNWLPTSPPQHAPHHVSYTKVAGSPSLAVGKAPYLHLTPRDVDGDDDDLSERERKYPAPAAGVAAAAAADKKPSAADEDEEEDSTSGLNDSFIDRLLTKHHADQQDEAKSASQPDAATLAHRAGIAAAAQASLSAREAVRARAISAAVSSAPVCSLCESAPGAVWCAGCRMFLCGTEQNNCDRDLHNQSDKMRAHARESAALKMKRDKLQALRGGDLDDDDEGDDTQQGKQQQDATGHSVFGNTAGIMVNAGAPASSSAGRSHHEASPEVPKGTARTHAKSNPMHHSFNYPAEPAATPAAVSASPQPSSQPAAAADASPAIVPSQLFAAASAPSPSPSPLPPRTGSAFLSFPLPADFGRDMGPRRTSPAPAGSTALAHRQALAAAAAPPASQLSPPPVAAAATQPVASSNTFRQAASIEAALSPSSAAAAALFGSSSSSLPSMEELEAALDENQRNMERLGLAQATAPATNSGTLTKKMPAVHDRDSDEEIDEADASSSLLVSPSQGAPRRPEFATTAAAPAASAASAVFDESVLDHSSDSWDTSVSSMSTSSFAATPPAVQPKSSSLTTSNTNPAAVAAAPTVPGREHASVRSCARGVQFSLDAAMARFNAQVAPAPAAIDAAAAVTEKQLQQDAALKRVEDMMQQLLTAQKQAPTAKSTVPSALAHLPPAAQQAVKAALRAAALSQQVNSQLTARPHPSMTHRGHDSATAMPQSMGQSLNLSGSSRRASFAQQPAPSSQLAASTSKHAASSRRPSIPPLPLPAQPPVAPSSRSMHRAPTAAPAAAAVVTVEDESVSPVVSTRRSSAPNLAAAGTAAVGTDRRHSTAVSVSQLNSRRSSIVAPPTEAPQQQQPQHQPPQSQHQHQQMLFLIEQQQSRLREQQQLLEESRRSIQMHQLELLQSQSQNQSRPALESPFLHHHSQSQRPQSMLHGTEAPASAAAVPLHLASSFPPRASMFAPQLQQQQQQHAWLPSSQSALPAATHALAASARAAPSDRPPIRGMFAARSIPAAPQPPQQQQTQQSQEQLHQIAPMQSSMQLRQQPQQQPLPQVPHPRTAWSSEQALVQIAPSAAASDDVASAPSPLSLQPTYALLSHTLDESAKRRQQLERLLR